MQTGARRLRGTTLAELLIAVVFLAACTSAILGCVWSSQTQSGYATRRSSVLATIQAQIYAARAAGRNGALTVGSVASAPTVSGVGVLTLTTTTTLMAGYTDLYQVKVSGSWTELISGTTRTDTMTISTYVRAPDA